MIINGDYIMGIFSLLESIVAIFLVEVLAGKILEVNRGLASHPEGN